ncbi:hypothetical protein D0T25_23430 [Duganella sp. BJB488]|uniref:hypothetical protein n=1 Tax=unclassified Duganella TaxID=2636909 RepID=UPI000E343435|nr:MULTISPECIES: hypothetical protein [unclassified Duganella]RFP09295.1 hypothetical protein D0T23_26685 [Duganella sp. BJB475]RFP13184.1 hypothetical protein D0T26_23125 [Duganella sp. BJB489]RFP17056.1 hypothetical protein D0T25_23430 [Duganella sp. BJB488]RFP25331.1 hypothetical protein D0T21_27715 [Duganella sp. BJB476]RFP31538.1 hypothetical protein D0T24_24215 [Duganella sp. BJB480]
MRSPAHTIHSYLLAKDGNRPHLMAQAFSEDAMLSMQVHTDSIAFPPLARGRDAIADVLVRRFGKSYENVYTFCLGPPPEQTASAFSCEWLVVMTDKCNGNVRVGCGRYDWHFDDTTGLAERLAISVEVMQILPPAAVEPVMKWVASLPYPWCVTEAVINRAANVVGVGPVLAWLASNNRCSCFE